MLPLSTVFSLRTQNNVAYGRPTSGRLLLTFALLDHHGFSYDYNSGLMYFETHNRYISRTNVIPRVLVHVQQLLYVY